MSTKEWSGVGPALPLGHVPGIYKKLHAIMSEASYIQKDKENTFHHYKYASEAAIKDRLHELFVKHLVLPTFSTTNHQVAEAAPTKDGKRQFRTTLDLIYKFVDIEDGSSVEGTMAGAGQDGEDKGTYKATTGALKYCLTSQFIIPTGDDPESADGERDTKGKKEKPANKGRESTTIGAPPLPAPLPQSNASDPEYITEPQRKRLYAIVSKAQWKDDEIKSLLQDFGISSSKHIPKVNYERICGTVENGTFDDYLDFKTNSPNQAAS